MNKNYLTIWYNRVILDTLIEIIRVVVRFLCFISLTCLHERIICHFRVSDTVSVLIFQTSVIPAADVLDPDVLGTMNSLQCFKDKDKLVQELLGPK